MSGQIHWQEPTDSSTGTMESSRQDLFEKSLLEDAEPNTRWKLRTSQMARRLKLPGFLNAADDRERYETKTIRMDS